jgi:hypothetical protein
VPAQHGQLAGHGNRCDLVTAAGSDAQEEGAQRSWCFRRSPRGLDQHCPGVRAAVLADASVLRQPQAGLADPRVQADVAHQVLWVSEAAHIADRRDQPRGDDQVDAGDGQQPLDCRIIDRRLRDVGIQNVEILTQPVELA